MKKTLERIAYRTAITLTAPALYLSMINFVFGYDMNPSLNYLANVAAFGLAGIGYMKACEIKP
ncbi:hypothetical protein HYT25_01935 [Candidatus Pacearchaeota archaeon]|nr:hypothetical protein [Candidatus Pacearchaeota archaeon]